MLLSANGTTVNSNVFMAKEATLQVRMDSE